MYLELPSIISKSPSGPLECHGAGGGALGQRSESLLKAVSLRVMGMRAKCSPGHGGECLQKVKCEPRGDVAGASVNCLANLRPLAPFCHLILCLSLPQGLLSSEPCVEGI